jgi:putative cell wall-binding protein
MTFLDHKYIALQKNNAKSNHEEVVKILRNGTKQKLIKSCMAALIILASTLIPLSANAALTSAASNVTRLGGVDQYATAALIAQQGWSGTCDSVVLSAGMNYSLVDALAAGPLAAALKAPILLTDDGQSLNSSARAELERLKPEKAYITSGVAVIKPAVLEELKRMGITPVQLGGYDQYETSVNIAKEISKQGIQSSKIILAAGWLSPADALSIAPIAAAQGIPILTTTRDQLPASVQTYLNGIKDKITDSYIVGGTAVIADVVQGQLPGKVSRYYGLTKYDTNIQILKGFAQYYKNSKVFVANGETLVDALAGVSLAAIDKAPIVLINQKLSKATEDFVKLTMPAAELVALGGEVVVPTTVINALTTAAQPIPPLDTTPVPIPTKLTVSSIKVLASDGVFRQVADGDSIDLTGVKDSVRFTGLQLVTNQTSPKIEITSIRADGLELIKKGEKISSTLDSNGIVTANALLEGIVKASNGISLGSLRYALGTTGDLVFKGNITKDGYTDSDVLTVTIHLGASVS